jgi:hypothetical protein
MALFPLSGVLRGFPVATYVEYVSPQTLVGPCSTKKMLISEWTLNGTSTIRGWAQVK